MFHFPYLLLIYIIRISFKKRVGKLSNYLIASYQNDTQKMLTNYLLNNTMQNIIEP